MSLLVQTHKTCTLDGCRAPFSFPNNWTTVPPGYNLQSFKLNSSMQTYFSFSLQHIFSIISHSVTYHEAWPLWSSALDRLSSRAASGGFGWERSPCVVKRTGSHLPPPCRWRWHEMCCFLQSGENEY